jgi:hypothetical protein
MRSLTSAARARDGEIRAPLAKIACEGKAAREQRNWNRGFRLNKRSQLFIGTHDETPTVPEFNNVQQKQYKILTAS